MYIKTGGFMITLPPGGNINVKKNDKVDHCSEVYANGKLRIMCKSCRTGTWLLVKPERLSRRRV